jgi:hypothetical protein
MSDKKPRTLMHEYLHTLAEDLGKEEISKTPNEHLLLLNTHRLKWIEAADARSKDIIDNEELIEILELNQIRYMVGTL